MSLLAKAALASWLAALACDGGCRLKSATLAPAAPDATVARSTIPESIAELEELEVQGAPGAQLTALAASGEVRARALALVALGRLSGSSSSAVLQAGLADGDASIRRAAAEGLSLAPDPSLVKTLAQAFATESDFATRSALARALGATGSENALAALLPGLVDRDRHVVAASARALGMLARHGVSIASARNALGGALGDRDPLIREEAADAVAADRAPPDPPYDALTARLADLGLHDPDGGVRAAAVRARAQLSPFDLSFLQAAAADGDWRVKIEAGAGLVTTPDGADLLSGLLVPEWTGISAAEETLTGTELHVLLAWLGDLWPFAARATIAPAITRILELSDVSDAAVDYRPLVLRGIALANCAAAALATVAGGGEAIEQCGGDVESAVARWRRQAWEVDALNESISPNAPAILERLAASGDLRVAIPARHSLDRWNRIDTDPATSWLAAPLVPLIPSAQVLWDATDVGDDTSSYGALVTAEVVTEKGDFKLALDTMAAPRAATAFVALAEAGRFRGLSIDAVGPDLAVQVGDPSEVGGPSVTIPDERTATPVVRGSVGFNLAPEAPNEAVHATGQLYIATRSVPELDGRTPVFAQVTSGMQVVDMLEPGDHVLDVYIVSEPTGEGPASAPSGR